MSTPQSVDWPAAIAKAYGAKAVPPLTDELLARIREELAAALSAGGRGADPLARANEALDAFEIELRSVVGPRVERFDEAAGLAVMKHRSEAGQPLRAFGGQ